MEKVKIPEKIYDILHAATWSMENNDNTMSGTPTREANEARDWLEQKAEWE